MQPGDGADPYDFQPGDKVGPYVLAEPVGAGGMAEVFVVQHPALGRRALKILKRKYHRDEECRRRFVQDAELTFGLVHPNIVRIFDVEGQTEPPYIDMELVEGRSLDKLLQERGRLGVDETAGIARGIASALAAAHKKGIVHRDVKPSNVLIETETGTPKLIDFGAARRDRPDGAGLTQAGQAPGTPRYMAPEQIDPELGAVGPHTDLWALGATLYEMLAGRYAFPGDNSVLVQSSILRETPTALTTLRPEVPAPLAELVARLLTRDPKDRPADAASVARELESLATPPPVPETPTPPATTAEPPVAVPPPVVTKKTEPGGEEPRRPLPVKWLAVGGIGAVAAALVLWIVLAPGPEPSPVDPGEAQRQEEARRQEAQRRAEAEAQRQEEARRQEAERQAEAARLAEAQRRAEAEAQRRQAETRRAEEERRRQEEQRLAEEARRREEQTTVAALPSVSREALDRALAGVPCLTGATATVEPGGIVRLAGAAAAPELAQEARGQVAAVPGVKEVQGGLGTVPAPGCVAAARVARATAGRDGAPPRLALVDRAEPVYREGDFLVVDLTMPPDLGGYLYLDLVNDNGEVAHLLPEPDLPGNRLPPGGRIRIGVEEVEGRPARYFWRISPPLSPSWLIATAAVRPLYPGVRPISELLADYMPVLLPALGDPAKGARPATVQPLRLEPKG